MSIQTYSVDRFIGLNQSGDENLMFRCIVDMCEGIHTTL